MKILKSIMMLFIFSILITFPHRDLLNHAKLVLKFFLLNKLFSKCNSVIELVTIVIKINCNDIIYCA